MIRRVEEGDFVDFSIWNEASTNKMQHTIVVTIATILYRRTSVLSWNQYCPVETEKIILKNATSKPSAVIVISVLVHERCGSFGALSKGLLHALACARQNLQTRTVDTDCDKRKRHENGKDASLERKSLASTSKRADRNRSIACTISTAMTQV